MSINIHRNTYGDRSDSAVIQKQTERNRLRNLEGSPMLNIYHTGSDTGRNSGGAASDNQKSEKVKNNGSKPVQRYVYW